MNHIRCDIAHFQQMPETYRQVIREILMECDEEFVPPLSMRRSPWQTNLGEQDSPVTYDGIASCMHDMQEESFLVATVPGTDDVMAFLAYMPGHVHPDETDGLATDYVSTICTRHRWRGHGIAKALYGLLEQFVSHDTITVRTWSTNGAQVHLLASMGYEEHKRIKDDRGQGIDTIYFKKRLAPPALQ